MKKTNSTRNKLIVAAFYLLLLLLWQFIFWIGTSQLKWWKSYAFPSPMGVWQAFLRLGKDYVLLKAFLYSLFRGCIGFLAAGVIGVLMGVILSLSEKVNDLLHPLLLGIQTLPSICWVPFAILWFGLDESAIFFVVIMGSAFSMALSVRNGIRNVNPLWLKAARTMGIDQKGLYLNVIFPAAMPEFVEGLRQGWSFAWRALMSGEVMSASIGLGHTLMMGRDLADINQVMLVMIIIVLIGILIDKQLFCRFEEHLLKNRGL